MTKTKYKVLALNGYGDHKQGDEIELELSDAQAKQQIAAGYLEPVNKSKKEEKTDA